MKKSIIAALAAVFIALPLTGNVTGPTDTWNKVVKITDQYGQGSGVVTSLKNNKKGCEIGVLTAKHVLFSTNWIDGVVGFRDPNWDSTVLGGKMTSLWSWNIDMAWATFQVHYPCKDTKLKVARFASEPVAIGDMVYHVGYPFNIKTYQPVYVTNIAKFNPVKDTLYEKLPGVDTLYVVVSNGIGPGSSGGGVFNEAGELVSIISIGESVPPGRAFTVPVIYRLYK